MKVAYKHCNAEDLAIGYSLLGYSLERGVICLTYDHV